MTLHAASHCPLCQTALAAPGVNTFGQMKCPRCGAELWAIVGPAEPLFFIRQPNQSQRAFLAGLAASLSGVPAADMEKKLRDADSLDLVELAMEIEAKLTR